MRCDYCSGWNHIPECVNDFEGSPWHCLECRTDAEDAASGPKWQWAVEERRNHKFSVMQLKRKISELGGKTSGSKEVLAKRLTSMQKPGDELEKEKAELAAAMVTVRSQSKPDIIKHYAETFNPVTG